MPIVWEKLKIGDPLPEYKKKPGITELVKYSAGSGDFNPLHHDPDSSRAQKVGSVIVHGRYKYAALGEFVFNWLGFEGIVREISCQYRGMDFPGKVMILKGFVEKKWEENGKKMIELNIWIENEEGKITTPGKAKVMIP